MTDKERKEMTDAKEPYKSPSCQNCDLDCCVLAAIYLRDAIQGEIDLFEKGECVCPNWFHYGKGGKVYHIETEDAWIEDEYCSHFKRDPGAKK